MPDLAAFAAIESKNADVRTFAKDVLEGMAASGDSYAMELTKELDHRTDRDTPDLGR
ncbi:MAG: hypothetical protein ACREMP_03450 [Candidatus Tyrphobacter sp.]